MEPVKTDSGAYLIRKKLRTKSVANIQIILDSKILMNKKYQSFQKRWLAHMLATILQIKCDERQKSGYNRGQHTDNGEPMISHLTSVLAEKSSFLHHCSSFVSYLIAIGILLKKAFTHKTGQSLIIMGWQFTASEKDASADSSSCR